MNGCSSGTGRIRLRAKNTIRRAQRPMPMKTTNRAKKAMIKLNGTELRVFRLTPFAGSVLFAWVLVVVGARLELVSVWSAMITAALARGHQAGLEMGGLSKAEPVRGDGALLAHEKCEL